MVKSIQAVLWNLHFSSMVNAVYCRKWSLFSRQYPLYVVFFPTGPCSCDRQAIMNWPKRALVTHSALGASVACLGDTDLWQTGDRWSCRGVFPGRSWHCTVSLYDQTYGLVMFPGVVSLTAANVTYNCL